MIRGGGETGDTALGGAAPGNAALDDPVLDACVRVERGDFSVDVELRAGAGETVALMGPSGAGKTTVVDALSGLIRIDEGRIRLGGADIADAASGVHVAPSRRGVGVLGQEALLFPHMTAVENIAFAARAAGSSRAEATALASGWLDRVGLAGLAARRPSELSGGQRQRVALARALAARPRLLLLDEPLVSLDVEAAADIRALLRERLTESGTTAVLVSHDAADALALADRLLILDAGRIAQQGTVEQVLAAPATRFAAAVAASRGLRPDPDNSAR
ncbi:ATP-binding cassette domain-containing protein [Leucobacter sp. CSA1]|uniref:ATP-binding cassette domain-containing protein n=1 Tax=Leucobacter chromiisoli TaxID=2796471 RepID=A0A934UU56_9MICO|nr:ATP-binding cassette domain-containing protein [Leucobacter chromiisoli]MBK0417617.1 ATP-binding cassette domain-containing protein [Leucobacter chromiisoli]